jgi:hypothetical protein
MRSLSEGWRRVLAAPAIIAGVFVLTLTLALPLALTLRSLLRAHLGASMMANEAADAVNYDWWQEFTSQAARGADALGSTFSPTIIGFAATLDNISSVLDGQREIVPIVSALIAYLAGWTFLAGGIIDRYARQRRTRAHGFFAACGVHFFRFARLALAGGVIYWWLFTFVHPWLFEELFPELTRDTNVERDAFLLRVGFYVIFGILLIATNTLLDYAKIRIVVEDRRSALGALRAAARFIARQPGRVFTLYALNGGCFVLLIAVWAMVAPGATEAGMSMWLAFALGQLYLLARLVLKLVFVASQTALFQGSLAHAAYAAAPQPAWPESPAAETIAG